MEVGLPRRVFKSTAAHPLAHRSRHIASRPHAYGSWSQESLEKAIVAVEKGLSIRGAAERHGIPRSTLHDHATGRIELYAKPGPSPYLTLEEEEELASFLARCARIGYPHTRQQVLAIVQDIIDSKNINTVVTNGWWERFRQRHPCLTLRTAVSLSYVRAMAQDQESIDEYYDLLENTLKQNGIFDMPTHLFNCDETGLPLNPKPLKVVAEVGARHPSYLTSNTKVQITVLGCTSAAGYALPPFVVFDRKTLNTELTRGEVPGTAYGLSANGWMDRELFKDWFLRHFLSYCPSSRPLLLLLDGHSSHFSPEMIKTAAAEGVIIFTLPPHTTHLSQPLDKGPFAPLKIEWRKVVHKFTISNPGRAVTRYEFSSLFAEAWCNAMSMKNIAAGFKVTGVYPFDRHAIKLPDEEFSQFKPEELAKSSGIKYIPLYSPARLHQDSRKRSSSKAYCVSTDDLSCSLFSSHCHSTPDRSSKQFDTSRDHSFDVLEKSVSEPSICDQSILNESKCFIPVRRAQSLSKFLCTPQPPSKLPTKNVKSSGRVLTSRENIALMEEREKKKKEEAELKEARKKAREEKKRNEALLKEERKVARAEKQKLRSVIQPKKVSNSSMTVSKARKTACFGSEDSDTRVSRTSAGVHAACSGNDDQEPRATCVRVLRSNSGPKTGAKRKVAFSTAGATRTLCSGTKSASKLEAVATPDHSGASARLLRSKKKEKQSDKIIVVHESAPSPKDVWWIKELDLTKSDLSALQSNQELTEGLISASHRLLSRHYSHLTGFQETGLGRLLRFSTVTQKGVQILHTGSHHWVCIAYGFSNAVHLLDSMGLFMSIERSLILQIATIYKCNGQTLSIQKLNVQQQDGTLDCGLFAVAFAVELCEGRDPVAAFFDQQKMRGHLHQCFLEGVLRPFPQVHSTRKEVALRPKRQILRYDLFCFCQMPELYDDMVQCDRCRQWVHCGCAGLKNTDQVKQSVWQCSECQGKGRQIVQKPDEFMPKHAAKKNL